MERPTFKIGDIVRLRSGGPDMTVKETVNYKREPEYTCQWFAGRKLESGVFQPESLEEVQPED